MVSEETADRYAEALLELGSEEGNLEELAEDVKAIKEAVSGSTEFRSFIEHPLVPKGDKREMLTQVFGESVKKETLNFLMLLVDNSREDHLKMICDRFLDMKMDRQNLTRVKVFSALEGDQEELKSLVKEPLGRALDTSVEITQVKQDKDLIGGIKLEIAGKVVDGSARRQLLNLREHLTSGGTDGSDKQ